MCAAMQVAPRSYGAGLHKVRYQTPKSIRVRVSTRPVEENGSETEIINLFSQNNSTMQIIANSRSFGGNDLSKFNNETYFDKEMRRNITQELVVVESPFVASLMDHLKPESPFGAICYDLERGDVGELNNVIKLLEDNQLVNAPLLVYGNETQRDLANKDYFPFDFFNAVPEKALNRKLPDIRNRYAQNIKELNRYWKSSLASLLTLDARDNYTLSHSLEAFVLVEVFGRAMGLRPIIKSATGIAAFHHDGGKIEWDDSMLKKDGKFTDEQFVTMKGHPREGVKIAASKLDDIKYPIRVKILEAIKYHHRRDDGGGYPETEEKGLDEFNLGTRCLHVADCVSAMSTSKKQMHRSYRENEYSVDDIIADLNINMSTDEEKKMFNREAAEAAIKAIKEGFSVETEIPIPSTNIFGEEGTRLAA